MTTAAAATSRYRGVSFWLDALVTEGIDDLVPRPGLDGDTTADVCIVGAGLTGLWSAYYLSIADPSLRILVVEKEIAGFGASGRNGGWCSAVFPRSAAALERLAGREQALRMRAAMIDTVGEVGRVVATEGIACDFVKGGTVVYARSEAQRRGAVADAAEAARFGESLRLRDALPGDAAGTVVATETEDCARLQPAKLVRGLARLIEERGVRILEGTEALDWTAGSVATRRGTVSAGAVLIALEGYGATVTRSRRRVLPLYSLMIATAPLPASAWDEIGLEQGRTFSDYRHLVIYGQRTADDRLAFGGRGARYHWGSTVRPGYDRVPKVFDHLQRALADLFPAAAGIPVTHRWGGPLGVPRDWCASVTWDGSVGTAGGYVGDGLSTTNLAGRTLADLVRGVDSDLTSLPWVGHASPSWEPEPLRFLGANAGLVATDLADREEAATRRPSVLARLTAPLTGH